MTTGRQAQATGAGAAGTTGTNMKTVKSDGAKGRWPKASETESGNDGRDGSGVARLGFVVRKLGELVQMGDAGGSNKVEGPNPKQTREHGWPETSLVN